MTFDYGYAATELYRTAAVPEWVGIITLQFLPLLVRAALFLAIGGGLCVYGVMGLYRSLNDILPSNQRNVLAEFLLKKFEQAPPVSRLLLPHPVKH